MTAMTHGTMRPGSHCRPVGPGLVADRRSGGVRGGAGAVRLARRAVAAGRSPSCCCPTSPRSATFAVRGSARSPTTSSTTGRSGSASSAWAWRSGAAPVAILGAILIAHVGMDRAVGYGLKLPTSFHDTHLGRMGREK